MPVFYTMSDGKRALPLLKILPWMRFGAIGKIARAIAILRER